MRLRYAQDIIDILRGKKKLQMNFEFYLKRDLSSSFEDRVKLFLKNVAPYYYPESKRSEKPDNKNEVQVCKNFFANYLVYRDAFKNLKELGIEKLKYTHENLSDEYSKEMFLKVLVFNIFDDVKFRLPTYYSRFYDNKKIFDRMKLDDEEVSLWNGLMKLHKYDLSMIGYDIKMFLNAGGIQVDLIDEQYTYKNVINVGEGDTVLDCGACYGDTALYFANMNNNLGKIYSFEFLPENIEIFNKNMDLNPKYRDNIELIQRPVSKTSGEKLYAVPNGPGTSITSNKSEGAVEIETISIDDFVQQNNISKIDFIKMDIEGSEADALKGAIKTIRKFKPKLAICAYHKKDDLTVLPALIKEILPEYKLYLDHYTINFTETVLYAKVD